MIVYFSKLSSQCIIYQADMTEWPEEQQSYKLVSRAGTRGFMPTGLSPDGAFMCILAEYQRLPPIAELGDAWASSLDSFTDDFVYQGCKLHSEENPALAPG